MLSFEPNVSTNGIVVSTPCFDAPTSDRRFLTFRSTSIARVRHGDLDKQQREGRKREKGEIKKKKIERKTREKMRLWTSFARTICQWQQQREKRGMKCMYKHTGALEERRRAKEDAFLIEEKKLNYLWVKRMYVCVNVYVCVWERGGASTVGLTKNIKKKK